MVAKFAKAVSRLTFSYQFAQKIGVTPNSVQRPLPLHNRPSPHLLRRRHIPTAFGARPHQQQVTCFDGPGDVPDDHLATAQTALDVGEQTSLDDAAARLEGCIDPLYHPVRGENAREVKLAPVTQNSGYPLATGYY